MTYPHLDYISGSVERVTFHSEATGFCVLRTKVKGQRDLVTITGSAASITAGEFVEASGVWVNDKKHGLQFKSKSLKVVPPTTLEGIEKYLGSGMVKGIGPHFAKKLVAAFGEAVFDVIETEPERLLTLAGIGEKRKNRVLASWAEQKSIRSIMVFLQSHGVGTARSVRIYKTYGDEAIETIQGNPYRLALDIRGIGFKTADALAQKLGIAQDSILRAEAGVRHVLQELCDKGHCAVPKTQLIKASCELLEISESLVNQGITREIEAEHLVEDTLKEDVCIYPISLYTAEVKSATQLTRLNQGTPPWGEFDISRAIEWAQQKTRLTLSQSQNEAIHQCLKAKISIITGGPGVGKTTLMNSLLKIIQAKRCSIALCAPTGRAAKRLSESTRLEAKTLHRLLEFDPKTFSFKHDQDNPLPIDVLVVDEASMLDIVLLNSLLKAIPTQTAVIFVGDIDQLPSVGSGAVLADLINSNVFTVVRLTEIFRQAASSRIIVNAHRVNQGKMPLPNQEDSDFFTLYHQDPEALQDLLINTVSQRLPKHYKVNPITDIQVLCPMNRGGLGSRSLNVALQQTLNGQSEPKIVRFGNVFSLGDKVIQMVNNYEKEVFNGDIGFVETINQEDNELVVKFDQMPITYDFGELDELSLAYAISIHKSQGSEFPIVVMPIATQHYTLLARNLLYTGMTRGKKLVVIIGQSKAVGMAVRNNEGAKRITNLAQRLQII